MYTLLVVLQLPSSFFACFMTKCVYQGYIGHFFILNTSHLLTQMINTMRNQMWHSHSPAH